MTQPVHEALRFFGFSARFCIIDNTNLARLRGSGKNAVIVPALEKIGRRLQRRIYKDKE